MRIGIDNVLISRCDSLSPRFPERILSERERSEYRERAPARRAEYLAGRFAAKEAYVKASGRRGIGYSRIEVLNGDDGEPVLYVDGVRTGQVSLTHDLVATAVVLLD